jgi:cholesterol transport system auxiliary component
MKLPISRFGSACAAALLLGVAGCTGSLLDSDLPVSKSYVLAPAPAAASATTVAQVDLSIGRPDLAPGLDTDRIAVLQGRQLDYYRAARWGGRATEVVQTLLVDSLEDQKLFRSVTAEQARVAGDYVLDVEVRDFQAEYASQTEAPTVNVRMIGRLIRIVDRELVGTVTSQAKTKATDNRMTAVVAAFETAAHQVAVEVAQKAAAAVADDEPKLRSARGTSGSAAQ